MCFAGVRSFVLVEPPSQVIYHLSGRFLFEHVYSVVTC